MVGSLSENCRSLQMDLCADAIHFVLLTGLFVDSCLFPYWLQVCLSAGDSVTGKLGVTVGRVDEQWNGPLC